LPVVPRPVDLRPLLEQVASGGAADRKHPVRLDVPHALPLVMADPDRVQQVVDNLLSNARKYSPRGGAIDIQARALGTGVEVSVTDHGLGVPQHALPHLFDKFYRVAGEDRRGIDGTGLGLAIARQIIEDHAGEIGATSPGPGQGTTFVFRLPVADALAEPGAVPPGEARPPEARPAGSLRVLLVDDDRAMRAVVTRILRPLGCALVAAASGAEALDMLTRGSFDAVVSDLHLGPGLDGAGLAEVIGQRWPQVRFVLATGSVGAAELPQRSTAIHAVIRKPYRPADLQRMLLDVCSASSRAAA
jgi:CheY-like chemotaxis protein/anti-sigma regulatory factor (Ser/Thr protein kinase)